MMIIDEENLDYVLIICLHDEIVIMERITHLMILSVQAPMIIISIVIARTIIIAITKLTTSATTIVMTIMASTIVLLFWWVITILMMVTMMAMILMRRQVVDHHHQADLPTQVEHYSDGNPVHHSHKTAHQQP